MLRGDAGGVYGSVVKVPIMRLESNASDLPGVVIDMVAATEVGAAIAAFAGHGDLLALLHQPQPLASKVKVLHDYLRDDHPFVSRIALATYDPQSDQLRTFVHSSDDASPLSFYQSKLAGSHSLSEIASSGRPRVVNDLLAHGRVPHEHAQRLRQSGYGASYTMPIHHNGALYGFAFFNSHQRNVFSESVVRNLNLSGHLLAMLMVNELSVARTLTASVRTVTHIAQSRDFETGSHLERVAHYTRLIGRHVAGHYGFNDDFLEYLELFSPLHDIGKVGVPDTLLLKPARLSDEEFKVIQQHTTKGGEIIDAMLEHFGMTNFPYATMLRNIALFHHEAMDGSGYPQGLCGEEIPVEARIVAVADVFDALSSHRPYKEAWDNERALATIADGAGSHFDPPCVEALFANREALLDIQQRFAENFAA